MMGEGRLLILIDSYNAGNVTATVRTTAGINKAEDGGRMDTGIGFANALQRVFPATVSSFSNFAAGSARRPCATEVQQHLI